MRVARPAERGKLDATFLAGTPAINGRIEDRPFNALEPTVVLASLAAATSPVGLIATASTTENESYNLAVIASSRALAADPSLRRRRNLALGQIRLAASRSIRSFGVALPLP